MTAPVALVTAASRGIGAACSRPRADEGFRLALLARGGDFDSLAKELDALAVRGSVGEPSDLARSVERAHSHFGRIDVGANNSGYAAKGDLLQRPDAQYRCTNKHSLYGRVTEACPTCSCSTCFDGPCCPCRYVPTAC